MRKIKEGYMLCYSYKDTLGKVDTVCISKGEYIQECVNNNMRRDHQEDEIINYNFFTLDGLKCTLEDATEEPIESGTYWRGEYTCRIYKLILNMKSDCPNFENNNANVFALVDKEGFIFYVGSLNKFTQVKNWEGDLL